MNFFEIGRMYSYYVNSMETYVLVEKIRDASIVTHNFTYKNIDIIYLNGQDKGLNGVLFENPNTFKRDFAKILSSKELLNEMLRT